MKLLKFVILFISFVSFACVKEKLYDQEVPPIINPEPEPPKPVEPVDTIKKTGLLININWDYITENTSDSMYIFINNTQKATVLKGEQLTDTIFIDDGSFNLYLYNKPTGITQSDNIFNIERQNNFVISNPGIFYSSFQNVNIIKDSILQTIITPIQQTKFLTIRYRRESEDDTTYFIYPDTVLLCNFASSYDISNEKEINPDTIFLNFTDYVFTINTFGVVENDLKIIFNGYSYGPVKFVKNINQLLPNFNGNKAIPDTIEIEISFNDIE